MQQGSWSTTLVEDDASVTRHWDDPAMAENERDRELRRRAAEAIQKHWKGVPSCPVCLADGWTIGDLGGIPRQTPEGNLNFGATFPSVPVVCDTCGYTMFFKRDP